MTVPNRNYSSPSYRYGFQGQEKDDEVKGNNNSYDFGARFYDGRIGRWFKQDAFEKKYPQISPYSFALNNPIRLIDPDGNTIFDPVTGEPIILEFSNEGELIGVSANSSGEKLKELLISTYNSSDVGKETILRLNSDDVKAKVRIHNKRTIWVFNDKLAGEVGALSEGKNRPSFTKKKFRKKGVKFKEEYIIDIYAYNIDEIGNGFTDDDTSKVLFVDGDANILELSKEKKQLAIKNANATSAQKSDKSHNDAENSFENKERELLSRIKNKDKKNKKSRRVNSLIWETANADRQADFKTVQKDKAREEGEKSARRAVIKANTKDEK